MFCRSGKLVITEDSQTNVANGALGEFADKIVGLILNGCNYVDVRRSVIVNNHIFNGDYEIMISAIADSVIRKNLNPEIIPELSEFAYRMSQVTDPSLQMVGAIVKMYSMLGVRMKS